MVPEAILICAIRNLAFANRLPFLSMQITLGQTCLQFFGNNFVKRVLLFRILAFHILLKSWKNTWVCNVSQLPHFCQNNWINLTLSRPPKTKSKWALRTSWGHMLPQWHSLGKILSSATASCNPIIQLSNSLASSLFHWTTPSFSGEVAMWGWILMLCKTK
jgi:hypothetical protein